LDKVELQLEFIQWDSHLLSKCLGRSLSTDLYALAVTAVMLLTKEATELFDAYSNQWNWRSQVTVKGSPRSYIRPDVSGTKPTLSVS